MKKIIFINPEGKEYVCSAFAMDPFRTDWEWFALGEQRADDLKDGVYFGFVHGFEDEWGYFSEAELNESGIRLMKDYKDLKDILPPVGWTKKA